MNPIVRRYIMQILLLIIRLVYHTNVISIRSVTAIYLFEFGIIGKNANIYVKFLLSFVIILYISSKNIFSNIVSIN